MTVFGLACFVRASAKPSCALFIRRMINTISVLNCDYKLASKIITDHLKQVMPSIVHSDQTCSVINRSIFCNLHLIHDTLDMINKTDETRILIAFDQMKASDRVDHKFGFGTSFCRWVSILYLNVFSRIICNGKISARIFLERGLGQGCPLSPILYVLTSEVLANQICKDPAIEGFLLPGTGGLQFKVSQYADDATNFVKNKRSLCHLLETGTNTRWGLGPSSIPPRPRQCGLVGGELMAPPPLVYNGLISLRS